MTNVRISLSAYEAKVLFDTTDAADAPAVAGGLNPEERDALRGVREKLQHHHSVWKGAVPGGKA